MAIADVIPGRFPAYLRCFRLSHGNEVIHLRSRTQFPRIEEIRETVENNHSNNLLGPKAVLFTSQPHLPADIKKRLPYQSSYIIAFCNPIYHLTLGQYTLPSSPAEHPNARYEVCPGFPITKPVEEVDPADPFSFGQAELKAFLGEEFYRQAGKILFLNLKDQNDQSFSSQALVMYANNLLNILLDH